MNIDEAKVESEQLVIGRTQLRVALPGPHPTDDTVALLEELAKRWNGYIEMVRFLRQAEYVFNCAILRTPTGDVRNTCTDLNIQRLQFVNDADERTKTKEAEKHEGSR